MKARSLYICQQCGYKSPSFLGKCPNCDSWNSLVETIEEVESRTFAKINKREKGKAEAMDLSKVKTDQVDRITTGFDEVDQVLGASISPSHKVKMGKLNGGLVPGSLVLLAGDPGIGKSTLTLQIISRTGGLYVSGEESAQQIKLRAERLGIKTKDIYILPETNIEEVIKQSKRDGQKFNMIIIDSIQTLWSQELTGAPGSVGQVRECALKLLNLAKSTHTPIILIGHVTKEGTIAGPKVLEHIVDTVLHLEGERFQSLRILRTNKNRYGPIDEVGVFSMEDKGMKEVANPSELFIGQNQGEPGSVVVATLEGSRPMLIEVQALTVATQMPIARRVGTGINTNRLQMLVAILQKHLRLPLGNFDIFVNAASGVKIFEPAADLGICLAIVSSFKNKPIVKKGVAIGEVGLLGEIRNVIGLERRIKEARKLGFSNIISSKNYQHLAKIFQTYFK